ncbi:hypothetical protein Taro_008406 [Colocasia esculenta]|uniref:Disease resistance protein RPS2 n=1 Tax=Colocasia esculenta TaxID=4460 RepID=A0A843U2Z1_COLES|nr:hypothetical protein [Colocasia esculenta]
MVLCLPLPLPGCMDEELQSKVKDVFKQLLDWSFGWAINFALLWKNAEALGNDMRRLSNTAKDVEQRVRSEMSQPGKERTSEVGGWLEEVEKLQSEVDVFRAAYERQTMLITGFSLGSSADRLLARVRDLTKRGGDFTQRDGRILDAPPAAADFAKEMEQLRASRDDLLRKVEVHERRNRQMKRTNQVELWLAKADAVIESDTGVDVFVDLLKRVRELKKERENITVDLVAQALPDAVEAVPTSSSVSSLVGRDGSLKEIRRHILDQTIKMAGICGTGGVGKTALIKVFNNEFDPASPSNGVPFDVVILVTVSRSMNMLQIQRDIGDRVGLSLTEVGPTDAARRDRLIVQQSKDLFRVLTKKKFLLLLDDLWEELDLEKVGIPCPADDDNYKQCKIVFTTRDEAVCSDMLTLCGDDEAKAKVIVPFLSRSRGWELFWRKCGSEKKVLANPQIRPLVERVVEQCGGLPLALVTVGKVMARKMLPEEWKVAVKDLEYDPIKVRGMEEKVLNILRFSYEALGKEKTKQCLLYCSLFPESHDIDRKQLIEYWIGDDLLDSPDDGVFSIEDIRNKGYQVIGELQAAHLLESGVTDEVNKVRLHDVVRDMVLWLTSKDAGAEATRFIALAGKGLTEVRNTRDWAEATKISLMRNKMERLPDDMPACPKLTTLLANSNEADTCFIIDERGQEILEIGGFMDGKLCLMRRHHESTPRREGDSRPAESSMGAVQGQSREQMRFSVPHSFFQFTGALRVLDLSHTSIDYIPSAIGLLGELQFLNLSNTKIRWLPTWLGNLRKLKQLDLSHTGLLEEIPEAAISSLQMLKVFNLYKSLYHWCWGLYRNCQMQAGLKCLEGLAHLDELGICLRTLLPLRKLACSRRLCESIRFLKINVRYLTSSHLSEALVNMTGLRELFLEDCGMIEQLEFIHGKPQRLETLQLWGLTSLLRVGSSSLPSLNNLRRLYILGCPFLIDLAWLGMLPNLQEMHLYDCELVEELMSPTMACADESFPELRELHLAHLPKLSRICRHLLSFPSLQFIQVNECPKLRELSLLPQGGTKIRQIWGEQEWWDALEWANNDDSQSAKLRFSDRFMPKKMQTLVAGQKAVACLKGAARPVLRIFPGLN